MDLNFSVSCKCGGSLTFSVNSVKSYRKYICPECSTNLGPEIGYTLLNIKDSLEHHTRNCEPLHNVRSVRLNGKVL